MTVDADAPRPVLAAVVGPTAAGKSRLAMQLADLAPVTILSADSRQLYRGFDIGTAKPTREEQRRVPHRGIDLAAPTERWSAARWADGCAAWVQEARATGRMPLVVGGTGFYLRALDAPLFDEPPLDPIRRTALGAELARLDTEALRARVAAVDPALAGGRRSQLLRAAEVAELTGVPLSELRFTAARPPRFAVEYLVVDPGPPLASAIARRVDTMLDDGWLDEVRALAALVPADAPAWQAAGYDAWRAHLAGMISFDAARERTIVETRQYAKRQRTWFRHQPPPARVERLDPHAPDATERALAWWTRVGRGAAAVVPATPTPATATPATATPTAPDEERP